MTFDLGNIANKAVGAIKPYSPIKIDANAISTSIKNAVDKQFSGVPITLQSALSGLSSGKFNTTTAPGLNTSFSLLSSGLSSLINAKPNPLNDYANYTYHIKFFMANDVQSYNNINRNNPNSSGLSKIVIAESGVTAGFNITSLTTQAAASGNASKRNMWSNTNFELIITEPLGITLVDKIYYSAVQLGVVNQLRCPFFLEIWFTGYNEDGTIAASNLFYSLNRVTINQISAASTHAGTTYTITLLNDNTWAELNPIATPPSGISIHASTLGEFFTSLEYKWNNIVENINSDGLRRNHYKFSIPEDWKSWTLRNPDILKQNARNTSMTAELKGTETVVTISRGQSVENIVDFVVYLCQEAQKWITGENSPAPGAASLDGQGMIRYVTVYPKIELNSAHLQDPVTLDYIREVTYMLIPTESVKAYTDMETVKRVQNITTQENKLRYLISNNRLAKKYDYIYTGKNTEVLKFDFNIATLWTITQPAWLQTNSYDQYTFGQVTDINSAAFQQVTGLLNRTRLLPVSLTTKLDSTINNLIENVTSPVINAISSVKSALIEEKNILSNQLNTQLGKITSGLNLSAPSTSADTSNSLSNGLLKLNFNAGDLTKSIVANAEATALANIQQTTKFLTNRQRTLSDKYAEDAVQPRSMSMLPVTGQFDPKPTQQLARQNADQNKIGSIADPNAFLPGTGLVGSIISNVFQNSAFQNIDLSIRGDPWWIPIGNIEQNRLAADLVGNQLVRQNNLPVYNACYLGGDNEILLEFRSGVLINEETGLAVANENGADFFTGLYHVTNVTNTFARGEFTQLLNCARDVLSDTTPGASPGNTSRDRQDAGNTATPPGPSVGPGTVAAGSIPAAPNPNLDRRVNR